MHQSELTLDIATVTNILEELERRGLSFVYVSHRQPGRPDDETRLDRRGLNDDQAIMLCESAVGYLSQLVRE